MISKTRLASFPTYMTRSDRNLKALGGASANATLAFNALHSPDYENVPKEEKEAWAMAAFIHCDLARLAVSLSECEPGIAKLLAMADIVSKLYEAKNWYQIAGAKSLRAIAQKKSCGVKLVDETLKELKSLHTIASADKYAVYRNKIGYHYDAETPVHLHRFGQEDSEAFYALLITFVRFAGAWASLTSQVIKASPATPQKPTISNRDD